MAERLNNGVIEAVHTFASYELVVDQIRRAILLGRFPVGQKLPPERELAQQLAVSRTTVREAIRVLQGEGLVETRRGRSGGATVLPAALDGPEARLSLRQRLSELESVADFRLIIEPAAARRAAERRTSRDVTRLHHLLDSMSAVAAQSQGAGEFSRPSRFLGLDSEFHHRIGAAAGNAMLLGAVDDARAALFLPVGAVFTELHPSANVLHEEIVSAIESKDATGAERAMFKHVQLTQRALKELAGGAGKRPRRP